MEKSQSERADDTRIMKLFRKRCIVCMQPATEINEIVMRSRSRDAVTMKNNRVPLCHLHHHLFHWSGVTDDKMEKLHEYAVTRLKAFSEPLEKW